MSKSQPTIAWSEAASIQGLLLTRASGYASRIFAA
jgi:hypothetical protein